MRRRAAHAIAVLVAHRPDPYREALVAALRRTEDFRVVDCVRDCDEAAAVLADEVPDLLLADARLPGGGGLSLCPQFGGRGAPWIVIMSVGIDRALEKRARALGAAGLVDKGAPWGAVCSVLRAVAASGPFHVAGSEV